MDVLKKQVVVIGGGESFKSHEEYINFLKTMKYDPTPSPFKGWKANLQENLGDDYEVIYPKMPSSLNAKYYEWEIYFKKVMEYVRNDAIFVGHSLGGIFLIKFLSDHIKDIDKLILVAAPFSCNDFTPGILGYRLFNDEIHIFQSFDDHIVPIESAYQYSKKLTQAKVHIFKDRGHFINDEVFPELIQIIKNESDDDKIVQEV